MYVCICKQVSDSKVLEAYEQGHKDLDALTSQLGLGTGCGACRNYTRELLDEIKTSGTDSFSL